MNGSGFRKLVYLVNVGTPSQSIVTAEEQKLVMVVN